MGFHHNFFLNQSEPPLTENVPQAVFALACLSHYTTHCKCKQQHVYPFILSYVYCFISFIIYSYKQTLIFLFLLYVQANFNPFLLYFKYTFSVFFSPVSNTYAVFFLPSFKQNQLKTAGFSSRLHQFFYLFMNSYAKHGMILFAEHGNIFVLYSLQIFP